MTSPGGRIEIRVDPDLRGFGSRLSSGLESSARSGVARFAAAAKTALVGAAVGIGAAAIVATKSTLDIGMAYQDQLNTLRAVSGATEAQMRAVGATAKELGSDLTLPATSAADAAAVMTELAKASFTVEEAQQAAKGSLQLAAAAQIDGARAATIQANAINAFNLKASDAGRVADVLANAANASSAEITDVADALAQAAAVASSANIPIEDTAAALGILANNGIRGSDAGTLLKSALLALQSPSKQARDAMDDLSLVAYDSQGNFVGLRSIFEQLQAAQGRMTQQQYEMAASTLFGSDAARLAGIAAREGGDGFDVMAEAIGRQGAAAEVAAAKAKGLRGAIEAFKSQVETVQIDVFERAAPGLERLVRAAAERLPEVADTALATVDRTVSYFQGLAPRIGQALSARRDAVVHAWQQLGQPLVEGAKDLADKGLDVIVEGAERVADVAGKAVDTVEPLADSVGHLASSLAEANGPLETAGDVLGLAADAAGVALDVLGPLVRLAGTAVDIFADLPGPLQSVVLGFAALKVASSVDFFGRLAGSEGRIRSSLGSAGQSVVGFAQTVRTNMSLAGDDIGRVSKTVGAMSVGFQTHLPGATRAVGNFTAGLSSAYTQARQLRRFDVAQAFGTGALAKSTGDLAGLTAAAKTAAAQGVGALRRAGGGLVSFLGGPWGAALAGAGIAVALYQAAAQKAQETEQGWVEALKAGGKAAREAASEMDAARTKLDEFNNSFSGKALTSPFATLIPGLGAAKLGIDETVASAQDARKAYDEWYKSLDGSQRAQADVTRLQGELNEALDDFGPGSLQANEAAQALATAQGNLAGKQRDVENATRTATQALVEQAQQALGAASADLALRQARLGVQQAQERYNQVLADGNATAEQRTAAEQSLEGAYYSAAQAAAQKAQADNAGAGPTELATLSAQAQLKALEDLAAEMGGNVPVAVQQLIASLQGSAGQANTTAAQMDDLGLSVKEIPNDKSVIVDAPTADQKKRLEDLGLTVQEIPGSKQVIVTADTSQATEALNALIGRNYAIRINATIDRGPGVQGFGLASGGYIRGPGTATSDSIPIWASDGEYMHQAAVVALLGRGTEDALNRGDWRAALPRIQELADRQSRATLAAVTAGRQAGRYAAGGYVDAQARAAAGVVTVPQRVTNIRNNLYAAPGLPTIDQLNRLQRRSEVLAGIGRA